MRKIASYFLVFLITITLVRSNEARAEMPVKARAFASIVGYGTAGGAILGLASMAFGTSTRAVAQGASLGLYAGILFGTYVLVSHHNRRQGSYDDNASPYKESNDIYGDEYQQDQGGSGEGGSNNSFFNRLETVQQKFGGVGKNQMPPIKVNFLNVEF